MSHTCIANSLGIHQVYQPVLALKLEVMQIAKLLSHNSALYQPTVVQKPQDEIIERMASVPCNLWSTEEWKRWCGRRGKAKLPLHKTHLKHKAPGLACMTHNKRMVDTTRLI